MQELKPRIIRKKNYRTSSRERLFNLLANDSRVTNRPHQSWINLVQLSLWRVESTSSNSPSGDLDQSIPTHPLLLLRALIELSIFSSRLELPLKLYDNINIEWFSRINSNQSYKTITVNLTP